jgi:Sigma-70, region 4
MNLKIATAESESSDVVSEPLAPTPPSQVRFVLKNREGDDDARLVRRRGRSRRKRAVRGKSICVKRLTKLELALGKALFPDVPVDRPKTRGDCAQGERPCPFVSCTHHLYLDVFERTGAIKLNFPDLEVWEMADSCALDVADRNGTTLEEAGALMNLTRERIRQLEVNALAKLEVLAKHTSLNEAPSQGAPLKKRLPVVR